MKIALYTRVSTREQSDAMQLRDLRAYAAARGFVIEREYQDIGWSGARERRPGLDRLMADARKRRFDAVLVWKFDRFARSVRHLLAGLEEFRVLGIQFVSFQENLDTASPLGQAVFTIVAAVAELERDLIRERVRSGLAQARAAGRRLGRPRRPVDCELARMLQAEGRSLRAIARLMHVARATLARALAVAQNPSAGKVENRAFPPAPAGVENPARKH